MQQIWNRRLYILMKEHILNKFENTIANHEQFPFCRNVFKGCMIAADATERVYMWERVNKCLAKDAVFRCFAFIERLGL